MTRQHQLELCVGHGAGCNCLNCQHVHLLLLTVSHEEACLCEDCRKLRALIKKLR